MFIDLCFYWHQADEIATMRRVLQWLATREFEVVGSVLALRSERGVLPRYEGLSYLNLPPNIVRETCGISLADLIADSTWAVADVDVVSSDLGKVKVLYGLISPDSFSAGAVHPINISINGIDLITVESSDEAGYPVDPAVREGGKASSRTERILFEGICDELRPTYASNRWDQGLDPPTSLIVNKDPNACNFLYLDNWIIEHTRLETLLRTHAEWNCEARAWGSWVWFERNLVSMPGTESDASIIRNAIGTALLAGR